MSEQIYYGLIFILMGAFGILAAAAFDKRKKEGPAVNYSISLYMVGFGCVIFGIYLFFK